MPSMSKKCGKWQFLMHILAFC